MDQITPKTSPPADEVLIDLSKEKGPGRLLIAAEFALILVAIATSYFVSLDLPMRWEELSFTITMLQGSPPFLALLSALFLWWNGGIRELVFGMGSWKRLLLHVIFGVVVFTVLSVVFTWAVSRWLGVGPDTERVTGALSHPHIRNLTIFVIVPVWAFAEEFFCRAYLIQRLEKLTAPWRHSTLVAVVGSSVLFALSHLQYGLGGLPEYLFAGLLFALIYLYSGRSILVVSIIHCLFNLGVLS